MWLGWVGTDTVASDSAADDTITVNEPKKFCVGGRIQNTTTGEDNSGEGYEITAVDYTTGEITLGTALTTAWLTDDVIAPFLPSTTTVGEPLANRLTTIDIGSDTSKKIQSMSLTLNDAASFIEDEITTEGHPTDYLETERDLRGSIDLYFRKADLAYFRDGFEDTELDVSINFGNTAGAQAVLNMPQTSIEVPTVSTNAPAINLSIGIMALGSSGEDSCSLTFT
jgi:hypothetical protein